MTGTGRTPRSGNSVSEVTCGQGGVTRKLCKKIGVAREAGQRVGEEREKLSVESSEARPGQRQTAKWSGGERWAGRSAMEEKRRDSGGADGGESKN